MEGLFLSDKEQQYYNDIFNFSADMKVTVQDEEVSVVSSKRVREIFTTSHVSNNFLKKIWHE